LSRRTVLIVVIFAFFFIFRAIFFGILSAASLVFRSSGANSVGSFLPYVILFWLAVLSVFSWASVIGIVPFVVGLILLASWFPSRKKEALTILLFSLIFMGMGTHSIVTTPSSCNGCYVFVNEAGLLLAYFWIGIGIFLLPWGFWELRPIHFQAFTTRSGTVS
jgi:hypothetical protein